MGTDWIDLYTWLAAFASPKEELHYVLDFLYYRLDFW